MAFYNSIMRIKNLLPADFFFTQEEKNNAEDQVLRQNIERLGYMIYIGLPIALLHILIFASNLNDSDTPETKWRWGIIIAHFSLFVIFLIAGILTLLILKKKLFHLRASKALPHIIFLTFLVAGAAITGIDQIITNSITPFLLVCLLSALVLFIQPFYSAAYFLLGYIVFHFMLSHFQTNPEVLQSNYVNGITSIAIAWFLSLTLWRNNLVRFRKDRIIKGQQTRLEEQNSKLKLVASELNEASKTKDKLFSIISHDLRSPLANLQGILKLMHSGDVSETEFKTLLAELSNQAALTNDLLENLLSWSRSKIKGATVKPEVFSISEMVEIIIQLYRNNALEKRISICNNIKSEHILNADKGMIALVLRNLLSNAIKFSKEDGLVELSSKSENGVVTIIIRDSGLGVPENKVAFLFTDINYTTSGTAGEKGTGLGLILCKEFVEANGGKISVESRVNEGSVFSFTVTGAN
jgi:signal transduction histidine kinase